MLRITIEIVPHGNECQKKTIGVAHIVNIGGSKEVANYAVYEMTESGIASSSVMGILRHPNVFRFLEQLYRTRRVPALPPEEVHKK